MLSLPVELQCSLTQTNKLARSPLPDGLKNNQAYGAGQRSAVCPQAVSFRYKKELDPTGISQFGLVAEEVEEVQS